MFPPEPTNQERAAVGNGDLQIWIEYEGDSNRSADWQGSVDPADKPDIADLLSESFLETVFRKRLERFFNGDQENSDLDKQP